MTLINGHTWKSKANYTRERKKKIKKLTRQSPDLTKCIRCSVISPTKGMRNLTNKMTQNQVYNLNFLKEHFFQTFMGIWLIRPNLKHTHTAHYFLPFTLLTFTISTPLLFIYQYTFYILFLPLHFK